MDQPKVVEATALYEDQYIIQSFNSAVLRLKNLNDSIDIEQVHELLDEVWTQID